MSLCVLFKLNYICYTKIRRNSLKCNQFPRIEALFLSFSPWTIKILPQPKPYCSRVTTSQIIISPVFVCELNEATVTDEKVQKRRNSHALYFNYFLYLLTRRSIIISYLYIFISIQVIAYHSVILYTLQGIIYSLDSFRNLTIIDKIFWVQLVVFCPLNIQIDCSEGKDVRRVYSGLQLTTSEPLTVKMSQQR